MFTTSAIPYIKERKIQFFFSNKNIERDLPAMCAQIDTIRLEKSSDF